MRVLHPGMADPLWHGVSTRVCAPQLTSPFSSACVGCLVSPLEKYGEVVADMLFEALRGEDLPGICKRAGQRVGVNVDRLLAQTRDDPMTACYVDSSFPAFLYYLAKVSRVSLGVPGVAGVGNAGLCRGTPT